MKGPLQSRQISSLGPEVKVGQGWHEKPARGSGLVLVLWELGLGVDAGVREVGMG